MTPPTPHDDLRQLLQATLSGAYVIERELTGGGMSRVFVANETALDRRVVVKVLPEARDRACRAAAASAHRAAAHGG